MTRIYLDFETRSDVDIKAAGAHVYAQSPSTDLLLGAYSVGFGAPRLLDLSAPLPEVFRDSCLTIAAHNAQFERLIWAHIGVPRYGWPALPLDTWDCTAARARAYGLPGDLDRAAPAAGLEVAKSKEGAKLMKKICSPLPAWVRTGQGPKYYEDWFALTDLGEYCMQDVRTGAALDRVLPALSEFERAVYLLDQIMGDRGIPIDRDLVEAVIPLLAVEVDHASQRLEEITGGAVTAPSQGARLVAWANSRGVPLANYQALTLGAILGDPDAVLPAAVREALEIREGLGKAAVAKYAAMLTALLPESGVVQGSLLYYGAHTGRWTSYRVQAQNLFKSSYPLTEITGLIMPLIKEGDRESLQALYGSVTHAAASCLRAAIAAPKGQQLICADYSSIEARIVFWLAGEVEALQAYRDGVDLYRDLASRIFGVSLAAVTKKQREIGKRGVLGLGYQMGAPRFVESCAEFGITITLEFAQRVVETYRARYARVKKMWAAVEAAALDCVQRGKRTQVAKGVPIAWELLTPDPARPSALVCQLPSGGRIVYQAPHVESDDYGRPKLRYWGIHPKTKRWSRLSMYGGMEVENAVQRLSRDLMAGTLLDMEAGGLNPVMTVHDEGVGLVSVGGPDHTAIERIMREGRPWARDIPLGAEGWTGTNYRKPE